MRKCKCGKEAKWLKKNRKYLCDVCATKMGILVKCYGEAHSNPYIDNCSICMPRWGLIEVDLNQPSTRAEREKRGNLMANKTNQELFEAIITVLDMRSKLNTDIENLMAQYGKSDMIIQRNERGPYWLSVDHKIRYDDILLVTGEWQTWSERMVENDKRYERIAG